MQLRSAATIIILFFVVFVGVYGCLLVRCTFVVVALFKKKFFFLVST